MVIMHGWSQAGPGGSPVLDEAAPRGESQLGFPIQGRTRPGSGRVEGRGGGFPTLHALRLGLLGQEATSMGGSSSLLRGRLRIDAAQVTLPHVHG